MNYKYFGNMIYQPGTNKVLIKPDEDISSLFGFTLSDNVEHFSISGVVDSIGPLSQLKLSTRVDEWTRSYNRQMPKLDVEEISKIDTGDKVLFSFFNKFDPTYFEDLLLIDFESIYGVNGKGANGYALVELLEKEHIESMYGFTVENDDINMYGYGMYEGELYAFNPDTAARMEMDMHNTLTTNQSSLFRVKKTDLWPIKKEKSI